MQPWKRDFTPELVLSFSRSSGPGGQNVNKVSSKAELSFDVKGSMMLTDEEKAVVFERLSAWINREGFLKLSSQESRQQMQNRHIVKERFYRLLQMAFHKPKKRVATKPTVASREERSNNKRLRSLKKILRSKRDNWED